MRIAASVLVMIAIGPALRTWADDSSPSVFQARSEAPAPVGAESFQNMIERLTVTARRREERVQRVPVAVTVLSEEELQRDNRVRRLEDIQNLVPNLVFDPSTGALGNTSRLVLRGFGQADPAPTADPGVGVYVDGVYQARSAGLSFAPIDIERVEVLRGPQGTLFGKNTVGGAISVTTRRPNFDLGGSAELRVGNLNTLETRWMLNLPLIPEKAAARFSLATATREGYQKNVFNGQEVGDNKLLAGRAEFIGYPNDNLEVMLSLDSSRQNQKPLGGKCAPATGNPRGAALAEATGVLAACREIQRLDEFKGGSDFSGLRDALDTYGATSRITWDIASNLTLTSITGYRRNTVRTFLDFDVTPVPLLGNDNDSGRELQSQFSQELQLTGNTNTGRLRYTLGLFALNDDVNNREFLSLMVLPTRAGPVPNPTLTLQREKIRNRSYALYGQSSYSLSDRLELTVGARLSSERKRVFTSSKPSACRPGAASADCASVLAMPPAFEGFDNVARFSDVSPMVSLSYELSPMVLAYASYSTAFQSGGFQGNAQRAEDTRELAPQAVTSYEIGIKSRLLSDRLLFDAALFDNKIEDARIPFTNVTDGGGFTVTERNAANTRVYGAELELGLLATRDLQLFAAAGAIHSRFVEFDDDVPDPSIEDERPPFTPAYTLNLRADYERTLGSLGDMGLRASWTVRGRMNSDAQATEVLQTRKYGLLDGRISWGLPDGRTELAAYGTNLLDRRYLRNGISFADAIGVAALSFGPPRLYGVEIRRAF